MKLDDGRVELLQGKLIQNSLTNALKNGKNLFAEALVTHPRSSLDIFCLAEAQASHTETDLELIRNCGGGNSVASRFKATSTQLSASLMKILSRLASFPYRLSPLLFTGLIAIGTLGLFEILSTNLAKPIEFQLRQYFGKDPILDPRIKLVFFDDTTLAKIRKPYLDFQDWELVLNHLSKHKPQRILIDQVFQIVENSPQVESLVNRSKSFSQVFVGVFANLTPLLGRDEITTNPAAPSIQFPLPWKTDPEEHIIGASQAVRPAFHGFGTINYIGHGQVPAAILSKEGGVFPTLGLAAAQEIEIKPHGIFANGAQVPVRNDGRLQVNLSRMESYYKEAKPMSLILAAASKNARIPNFNEGDTIFILPLMYTGNADYKSTPIGELPGGLLHVSVANSALRNDWIRYFEFPVEIGAVAGILALLLAHRLSPFTGLLSILSLAFFTIGAGIYSFVYHALLIPWAETCLILVATGLAAIGEKAKLLEMSSLQVKHTLAGLVSPKLLETLLKAPMRLRKEADSTKVTVMFIDIEGFSLKSSERDPNLVFRRLKQELSHLCHRVHLYGGIVDKTLGDGLMCYFGHNYTPNLNLTEREHAIAAIGCAIDIQVDSARRAIQMSKDPNTPAEEKMVFPLRIGINTGEVYAGNIGTDERIDLTIIGTTVNWAKRYEDSCESFRIMIGPRTKEVLTQSEIREDCKVLIGDTEYLLRHRELIVKHYEQKWSGWECNPFQKDSQFLLTALDSVSRSIAEALEVFPLNDEIEVVLDGHERSEPLEFTRDTITISSKKYLSKRDTIEISFEIKPGAQKNWHADLLNSQIRASVLWGIQQSGSSLHGLKFVDLTAEEKSKIVSYLKMFKKGNNLHENLPDSPLQKNVG